MFQNNSLRNGRPSQCVQLTDSLCLANECWAREQMGLFHAKQSRTQRKRDDESSWSPKPCQWCHVSGCSNSKQLCSWSDIIAVGSYQAGHDVNARVSAAQCVFWVLLFVPAVPLSLFQAQIAVASGRDVPPPAGQKHHTIVRFIRMFWCAVDANGNSQKKPLKITISGVGGGTVWHLCSRKAPYSP